MAGLAANSFIRVGHVDLGFEADHLVAFRLPTVVARAGQAAESFYEQDGQFNELVRMLPTLPGVVSSGGGRVPFMISGATGPMKTSANRGGEPFQVRFSRTTAGFIETLKLRIRQGRAPTERDNGALVNASLARYLAQFGPVLGQTISNANPNQVLGTYTVVGVFDDVVMTRPDEPPESEVMVAGAGFALFSRPQTFVVRVAGSGTETIAALRAMLQRIYPDRPARQIIRLEDEVQRATTDFRARSVVLGVIALMCVPLAMAGIAGALLHGIRQQSRELGIRIALGADGRDIRRRVVAYALGSLASGLTLGLLGGLAIGRGMSSYLFGVAAVDPVTIAGVALALAVIGWLSALWPAYRASTIDPSVVLRDT
jgi:putative ABC transport system permease protein